MRQEMTGDHPLQPQIAAMRVSAADALEWVFLVFLVISQLYYGFRYPLKYNSTGTSPTYTNTPFVFEVAKYVLAMGLLGLSVILAAATGGRTRKVSKDSVHFLLWTMGFAAYCLALGVTFLQGTSGHQGAIRVFRGLFFFPLVALIPFHFSGWRSLKKYFHIVVIFGTSYQVVYSAVELFAFVAFRRLPALAYPGGLARFGGGWDDPNGFGAFLVLPLLFLLSDGFLPRKRRILYSFILVSLLLLTVSLAAFAAMTIAGLLYAALARRWWWIGACLIVLGMPLLSPTVRELIWFAYQAKHASIEAHLSTMSLGALMSGASLTQLLFGTHGGGGVVNESYYVALLGDFGLVGVLWFVSIIGMTIINAARRALRCDRAGDHRGAETFRVLAAFIGGLSAAAVGIPYYLVFPVNLYLWIAIFAVWLTQGTLTSGASDPETLPVSPRAHALS